MHKVDKWSPRPSAPLIRHTVITRHWQCSGGKGHLMTLCVGDKITQPGRHKQAELMSSRGCSPESRDHSGGRFGFSFACSQHPCLSLPGFSSLRACVRASISSCHKDFGILGWGPPVQPPHFVLSKGLSSKYRLHWEVLVVRVSTSTFWGSKFSLWKVSNEKISPFSSC